MINANMIKKVTKNILLWGDGAMTMNTQGELIFTMEIKTLYYIWRIPVWRKIKHIDGTEEELLNKK